MMRVNAELKAKAEEYIKKCNVVPLVHANEGGVIELACLLAEFADIIFNENKKLAKFVLIKEYPDSPSVGTMTDDSYGFITGYGEMYYPGIDWFKKNDEFWSPIHE